MMTTTAITKPAVQGSGKPLAGTASLIRFILRRDRIKLPAWLLGPTFLAFNFGRAITEFAESEERRQDMARFMEGGLGAIFGPGYGRENVTPELYIAGVYGIIFFVLAALMSLQLVSRHTRVDEQNGRAELIRSYVVGRHAQLSAALLVAVGANLLLALMLAGAMARNGFDAGDGLLFGASVAAVGLVFAAITAVTVQVSEYPRAATGMAGAVLGAAWVVRAAGDMIADHGSGLSWVSPLAWSNQTRPYVDGRWWPLLLSVGLAVVMTTIAFRLAARRDLGAGMMAARAGKPAAPTWLDSPLATAFRLQRAHLVWWTVALAAFGFIFGAVADQVADPEDISDDRLEMFGGAVDTLIDGYLGVIILITATLASIMVLLGVLTVWSEETRGRAELVLATATSRWAWFGSHLAVLSAGLVALLLVVGLMTGLGTSIAVGDGSHIGLVTAAHLAHVPGVLAVLGVAALLFGVLPKAIGVTWALPGLGLLVGMFGALLDLPQGVRNLIPMEHTGLPPLDDISWSVTLILLVISVGLVAVGLAGFRRRDLETK